MLIFLFLLLPLNFVSSRADSPVVKTSLGTVIGSYKKSDGGRTYAAYEGIPYAKPPIGELRFKPPQPVTPWTSLPQSTIYATNQADSCVQLFHKLDILLNDRIPKNSEDCLYLNIYVPRLENSSNSLLPILFWINGDAIIFGQPNVFGAEYVMDRNVILVTFNYRLGPLGFLSTEDDVAPGNMGLKDQSMALRWLHDHAPNFGGNPNKITLIGMGAGGASVHYHYMSPYSTGLFQNGISISGTALNTWARTKNPLKNAKKLAKLFDCSTNSTVELVDCLKAQPARDLSNAVAEMEPWLYKPFSRFGPVVEKSGPNAFIDKPPKEILKAGLVQDIPWITGVTGVDGLYSLCEFVNHDDQFYKLPESSLTFSNLLDLEDDFSASLFESAVRKIVDHYKILNISAIVTEDNRFLKFQDRSQTFSHLLDLDKEFPAPFLKTAVRKITDNHKIIDPSAIVFDTPSVISMIRMVSHRLFATDAVKAAEMQAEKNEQPVLFYLFDYKSSNNVGNTLPLGLRGSSHGDDGMLLLNLPNLNRTLLADSDRSMRNDLLTLWSSFAENGVQNLVEYWPNVDRSNRKFQYLGIEGPGKFYALADENFREKNFWDYIERMYKNKP